MRRSTLVTLAISATAALMLGISPAFAGTSGTSMPATGHTMHMHKVTAVSAADLRVTLDQLLGEHAVLAMNATNLGVTGSKAFPAAAKVLDRNSVELSQAIGSIYGAKAGKTFLDGPFMWRAHIKFFVDYTVATEAGRRGQGQGRREPADVHREVRRLPRGRHGPAEARCAQRPAGTRPRAEGSARRVCQPPVREGRDDVPARLRPHVHDR